MKRVVFILFIVWSAVCLSVPFSFSEEDQIENPDVMNGAPRVFLDCEHCDRDYIRTEIPFVNYVRDRKDAEVHILITTQNTGSGGREYTMNFMGLKVYEGMNSILKYSSNQTDTSDDVRRGMAHVLKAGLIPYVAKTPVLKYITFDYRRKADPAAVEDKWDFWVFHLSLRGQLSGQKSYDFSEVNGNISANRITPGSKLRIGLSANLDERKFKIGDETISNPSDEKNFGGMWVKSLSEHWSLGGWLGTNSNTFNNIKFRTYVAPALEYNVFPYAESTRRQFRFMYRIGMSFYWYREETIFEKIKEALVSESMRITWEQKEPWGDIFASLEGSHYFHDFSKSRLVFSGNISFRLFKGFSMHVNGRYSRISDQLSLPKEGASLEEILLRIKELKTNYSYSLSLGFGYTFGSIYSNVVNPRFGW